MGAICLQEHSETLQSLVNDALDKGAEIAVRGSFGHLGEDAVDQYFPPTVLINVNHTMKVMKEEVRSLTFIGAEFIQFLLVLLRVGASMHTRSLKIFINV